MRPAVCFALGLLFVGSLAAGCRRQAAPGGEVVGPVTTDKTPDGEPLVATFPGKPEWADIPNTFIPAKGYVWPGDGTKKPCAVWVWTIPPEERDGQTDLQLAQWYGRAAAGTAPDNAVQAWLIRDGVRVGGWHSGPMEAQGWHDPNVNLRNPPRNRPIGGVVQPGAGVGAGVAIIVGNKAYGVRVTGEGVGFDDPEFVALLDSVRPPELEGRPPVPEAPDDDLRPLARLGKFVVRPGGIFSTGVAVFPSRGLVLQGTITLGEWGEKGPRDETAKLVRYRYPTFEADGAYLLSRFARLLAEDPVHNRLYLRLPDPGGTTRLARFDVPERLGKGREEPLTGLKMMDIAGTGRVCLTADGKSGFVLNGSAESYELVRFDAEEMKITDRVALSGVCRSLALSPDEKTLYVGAVTTPDPPSGPSGTVQEVDLPSRKVRRAFPVSGDVNTLTCGADGRLYLARNGNGAHVRIDPTGAGEPKARRIEIDTGFVTRHKRAVISPDARRLYALGEGAHPYSLDAQQIFDFGRRVIAPKSMRDGTAQMFGHPNPLEVGERSNDFADGGRISPDGKCLFLNSGHVFWLAGAGPLPEVDPAVKWAAPPAPKPGAFVPPRKDPFGD